MDPTQQRIIINAISLGADRETAANYARCTPQDIETAKNAYPEFAIEITQAEASAELSHIRAINRAAEDPKYWRASVFFLKARKPDRYGRPAKQITTAQLNEFAEALFAVLGEEFPDEQILRIRKRVSDLIDELERAN
jgi:hypothetical protein